MSQISCDKRALAATARRLDRLALEQLRDVAAQLHEQLEKANTRISDLERELRWADSAAEMWQQATFELQESLGAGHALGLTTSGELHVVQMGASS